MTIKQWVDKNNINLDDSEINKDEIKEKVILPYLNYLGYKDEDFRFNHAIKVEIGKRKTEVYSDIEIIINDKVEMVINYKNPLKSLSEKDVLQVVNFAKLVSIPQAVFGVITNVTDCVVVDSYYGRRIMQIPSKSQLLREIDKAKKHELKDIEIKEAESILFTLHNSKDLYKVIQNCKDIIEKRGLIRSDQSFREMTKILLVKMNEERRVKAKEGMNRFNYEHIKILANLNKVNEIEVFRNLFNEAKSKYPSIYTNDDEQINISDNLCIVQIIKNLEAFSFLGTGDDIKGAVYEIFLKATLRGEFDQYFTPREIVDFMVKFADPNIGDVILDPSCGSGGFLIQAFNYVNAKINMSGFSEVENNKRYKTLIDKCLWGNEADYDLHVLAKINLIMHGDGWNNIYQGDTLSSDKIPDEYFDLIVANPPFTIPYTFEDVLQRYELGKGKEHEELDILFVEKSIRALKGGCDLFIILPEGLLNNKKYLYFRKWLLKKVDLLLSVSLPEGAFIPFGGSVSKTCILGVRKKQDSSSYIKPTYAFLGKVNEIGYELGKKVYKQHSNNDLEEFEYMMKEVFDCVKVTTNGGQCGWINTNEVSEYRMDSNFLLNKVDRKAFKNKFGQIIKLGDVCEVCNQTVKVSDNEIYNYLEVPDISVSTGSITNIRKKRGASLGDSFNIFYPGDILFTRINPRINRVAIAPPISGSGIMSKEIFRIQYKKNKYIQYKDRYVLCAILQSKDVEKQIERLSTGSSSSRARVQVDDLLEEVYIPLLNKSVQSRVSLACYESSKIIWEQAQKCLRIYAENQNLLGNNIDINNIRSI